MFGACQPSQKEQLFQTWAAPKALELIQTTNPKKLSQKVHQKCLRDLTLCVVIGESRNGDLVGGSPVLQDNPMSQLREWVA